MATRVDATFFTDSTMPTVEVVDASLCKIVRIGNDISLFLSYEQLSHIASQLCEAVIDEGMVESRDSAGVERVKAAHDNATV